MIDFFGRLDKYMKIKGLNDNRVTVETGISNGLIGKARKRGSLSQDNISKILSTYSDLDANWLLTGEGEMFKKQPQIKQEASSDNEVIGALRLVIDSQKDHIDLLKEKLTKLQADKSEFTRIHK